MKQHLDVDELTEQYNLKFNGHVPVEYDSSPLDIDDIISGEIKPHTYQCAEVRRLSEQGAGICGFGTGLGKAQPLTAKILTPTGWRLMGDITVGDKVIGVDGKPTTVVGVFPQGEKEIFKVSFSDGSSTECCKEHLWLTQNCYERRKSSDARHYKEGSVWACAQPKVRTLEEIMDTLTWRNGEKNHSIPIVSPVEFESQDLPLDPYLLGCLLGDGGMTTRGIVFTNPDTEICDKIRELLSGYANLVSSKGKDYQYRITADGVSNPVTNVLEQLGLLGKKSYDKYIPDIYKFNSVESRIKLLNGLMDTDGYASKSGVTTQFSSSSKQLADDVVFLVQSLGGIATTKTKIPSYKDKNGERKYCHEHYIVNIRMPAEISAFSFTRKRERVLPKTKYIPVRYVTGVESVGKKPAQCIKVEHEKELYVTDDFIVTHNTTCALATAAYNYKHGRAKRTCVVVPSAVLENWYHESRIFYSEGYMRSNVLFVGLEPKVDRDGNIERRPILDEKGEAKIGKDGKPLMQDVIRFLKSKEDVYEAMWKIPQSNYSLVVMTKEKFQSIPIKPSTMKEYTDDMVKRHLMSEKEAASIADAAAKKRRSYQEDVHQAQLEGRFSDERTAKKGELPYLEDMGFDSIITDESHFFKNSLSGGDKTRGIVYVPNPDTSNIAVDMAIKSSWLRRKNNGRGIYGLTATPVTNSPVEIYNMLNLVAPKEEFESMGIHTVDDFVRFFGDIQQRMRSAVSGEIVNNDTLVGFKNLSGLRNLFRKYVNIKTVKDVDDEIHVPDAVEMEEEVDMTEEQALAYEGLRARAKEASKNRGANKGSDSIFSIMRDMDRCTTDMDLFKRQMTFILPREHKAKMAGLLPKLPTEFSIVEKDEVTGEKITSRFDFEPKLIDNGGDSFSVIVHEQHEAAVLKAIREYGIPENEATHPLTPKYAKMVENLKKHLDAGGKQIVFTEEKSQHQKIKRLLVHNLPITEDQIAIINAEEASGDKLDKISKAYNAGSVKIVIANKKAEVGVNLQKGTTAIHHLTLPWTPASINQRNGRGVRQGNKVDSVDVYYYFGKGTFDSYRKQLLQAKAGWIGELLMGKESRAENADVAADEETMAALTGTLEEYRAQKAAEEERRKNAAKAQLVNRLRQLTSIHSSLATLEGRRTKAKEDADYEVKAQERRIRKYEQENKGEEALKKAQEKLEKLKAKAASVDGKYDAEKKKSEAQRNMITGMLRQAGKDGSLPFDVSLIDHPENCLVSLDGEMYAIGEFLEFAEDENSNYYSRNPSGIYRITGLDQTDRTLRLENVMTGSTYRVNTKKLSSYAKKVSYSASELAMKRLLSGNMPYEALYASGLTRQQFMENAGSVSVNSGAFVEDSAGKMTLIRRESDKSENLAFVWPEPDNEDFRKRAMIAYLDAIKTVSAYSDPFMTVMTSLFGEEYMAEAQKYANNATATEMQAIIANAWEEYTTGKLETPEAKIAFVAIWKSDAFNSIWNSALEAFKQEGYDNLVEMRRLARSYLSCKHQEILSMAADAEREMQHQHDEELRKHPDYKEIPSRLREKFSTIGLDIRYNTEDTTLSFRRRSQSHKAFSRIFLCDKNGMGGVLYKLKEPFKARFDAQFTKNWHEKPGAWWHVPATVDLEELYNFLA